MTFATWRAAVKEYWKIKFVTFLYQLSTILLGDSDFKEFPRALWWFCSFVVFIGLLINSAILVSKEAGTPVPFQVGVSTPGAVCTCSSSISNSAVLTIQANQTAFDGIEALYESSVNLTRFWNNGRFIPEPWVNPLDLNTVFQQRQQAFVDQLSLIQLSVQFALFPFGGGNVNLTEEFFLFANLEVSVFQQSFIYQFINDTALCPTATCYLVAYPSSWLLLNNFFQYIFSGELIAWLVMYGVSSVVWNAIFILRNDEAGSEGPSKDVDLEEKV